ncbi:MAG: ribosome biogenesis GTPase Der [Dehalococcoidia bacterium]
MTGPSEQTPLAWGHKPLVAIVGRPNVGKSSLFNAIVGKRTAIVSDIAGTTRDRLASSVEYAGRELLLADTGGLVPDPESEMDAHIASQVAAAIGGADAVIFVTDARQGVTFADEHVAMQLRRWGKPVVLAVNKADNLQQEAMSVDLYELGLSDPIPVSAIQRRGLDEVLEAVLKHLPPPSDEPDIPPDAAQIAIAGRPNVGKSALANAILGTERSIVSPVAGTTRDALDTPFEYQDQKAVLIDTAGIRRRGAIEKGIERYSVLRAVRALDRCDVAVLVVDATEPATDQDLHIAGQIMSTFKGAVVAVNKWDLVEETGRRDEKAFRNLMLARLRFMSWVPVVFISALEGTGIDRLLDTVFQVYDKRREWVPQPELSRVVMGAISRHLPPSDAYGSLKLYRVKQEAVSPPSFVFYCNNPHRVHFSYERYLENTIREAFGFEGTHLKLEFRGKGKSHVIGQNRAKHAGPKTPSPTRRGRR